MNRNKMTTDELFQIAKAAGYDLTANGTKGPFARLIGVSGSKMQAAVRNNRVPKAIAAAAYQLAEDMRNGEVNPAAIHRAERTGTTVEMNADLLPEDPEANMTDDEILENINKRFRGMKRFADFCCKGALRSMIAFGPGGIGKTYPIEQMLRSHERETGATVRCITGSVSPVKFVEVLWECRMKGDIVLLDDADSGLSNQEFMNLLKAATDSKGRRVISWLKKTNDAPFDPQFEFEGSVIIISNVRMDEKAEKSGHYDAILSRAVCMDLAINSARALALRVAYMIEVEEMFAQKFAAAGMAELHDQAKGEIGEFIKHNKDKFRSLTLREADKIANLYIACEGDPEWAELALLSMGA